MSQSFFEILERESILCSRIQRIQIHLLSNNVWGRYCCVCGYLTWCVKNKQNKNYWNHIENILQFKSRIVTTSERLRENPFELSMDFDSSDPRKLIELESFDFCASKLLDILFSSAIAVFISKNLDRRNFFKHDNP